VTGNDLQTERRIHRLTLREVAPWAGLTHQGLARIEAQAHPPQGQQMRVLAALWLALRQRRVRALSPATTAASAADNPAPTVGPEREVPPSHDDSGTGVVARAGQRAKRGAGSVESARPLTHDGRRDPSAALPTATPAANAADHPIDGGLRT